MVSGELPISRERADSIQQRRAELNESLAVVGDLVRGLESALDLRPGAPAIPDSVARTLLFMLLAVHSSTRTIINLSQGAGLHTRDCYSIARSVLELCVNVCYIAAVGEDAADRAIRHARQEAYRDLDRESRLGEDVVSLTYSARPDPTTVPGLLDSMAEFTARSKREKAWIDSSIDDRIDVAGHRFGMPTLAQLHFARFLLYRHSSEVLHGSLFGVIYPFGHTDPIVPLTLAETAEKIAERHECVLLGAQLALMAVVGAFDAAVLPVRRDRSQPVE